MKFRWHFHTTWNTFLGWIKFRVMNCRHHLCCILHAVMLTHPGFWPKCPDREQTASVVSALGRIKIEILNYSERLLQAVWIPKWFASLTHYDSSQAVLINVIGGFSDCIWSQVWHITIAQQLKLALFVHILISHSLSLDRWAFSDLHIPLLPMYTGLTQHINEL